MGGNRAVSYLLRAGGAMMMMMSSVSAPTQTEDHTVPEPETIQPEAPSAATLDSQPPLDSGASPPTDTPSGPSSPDSPPVEAPSAEAPSAETASPVLVPAPDIAVMESQLFATLTDPGGEDAVTPTTSIPYVVGRSCYSWALKYAPVEGDLVLTEELVLPGPARNWGTEGSRTDVNAQRSRAVTERHFDARTGIASAGWCVAKDDPVGAYRYIIRQGEREVARFDFTVGDLL